MKMLQYTTISLFIVIVNELCSLIITMIYDYSEAFREILQYLEEMEDYLFDPSLSPSQSSEEEEEHEVNEEEEEEEEALK